METSDTTAVVDDSRPVVFLSIKPNWAQRILAGSKTVELRKGFATHVRDCQLFLYASWPAQAVLGAACVHDVVRDAPARLWKAFGRDADVSCEQFDAYYRGSSIGTAIRLADVRPLPAVPLATLRRLEPSFRPPMSHALLVRTRPIAAHLLALASGT